MTIISRLLPQRRSARRANGHRVYLCTGRSKAEIYDELWAIGLDGMIGGNGCYAEDHGQALSAAQCRAFGKRAIQ